jgi:hypothetical protein
VLQPANAGAGNLSGGDSHTLWAQLTKDSDLLQSRQHLNSELQSNALRIVIDNHIMAQSAKVHQLVRLK